MIIHGAHDVYGAAGHAVAMLGYVDGTERRIALDLGDMTDTDLEALDIALAAERHGRVTTKTREMLGL